MKKNANPFELWRKSVDRTLERLLPPADRYPKAIHEAMRYSVLPGGKRFRAVLALAACEAAGGTWRQALLPAAAVELVHCYSLVHDDLPCMDDDDFRRGRPTVHKKYGEAVALLAGDALLTLAFESLARYRPCEAAVELAAELSTASGTYGMIGGQTVDLLERGAEPALPTLDFINVHKTGKLIQAAAVCGAIAAEADPAARRCLARYGEFLGLAFQAADDLDDGDGYRSILSATELLAKTRDLTAQALRPLRRLKGRTEALHSLCQMILEKAEKGQHGLDR